MNNTTAMCCARCVLDDENHIGKAGDFCELCEPKSLQEVIAAAREAGALDMRKRAAELADAVHAIEWERPDDAFSLGYTRAADELSIAISALDPKGDRP